MIIFKTKNKISYSAHSGVHAVTSTLFRIVIRNRGLSTVQNKVNNIRLGLI